MTRTDDDAWDAVMRQLAKAYDRHTEEEQILVYEGRYDDAQIEHDAALRVLRAFRVESHPVTR